MGGNDARHTATAERGHWSECEPATSVARSCALVRPRRSVPPCDVMKRLWAYNGLVAIAFLLLWVLLLVIEVKICLFWFLSYIFFGSLPLVFVAFFFASWRALGSKSKHPAGTAGLLSVIITPIFIVIGVVLVTKCKVLIGGHF